MRVTTSWTAALDLASGRIDLRSCEHLLAAVARTGSLRGAADELGQSYRAVWGRLAEWERLFGRPLLAKTKGHGSGLTEFGWAVLEAAQATTRDLTAALEGAHGRLEETLTRIVSAPEIARLRLCASHDPGLVAALAGEPGIAMTIAGSREAVERLLAGETDAAGFHAGTLAVPAGPPFDRLAGERDMVILPAFTREQGLLVAPGNPKRIEGVEDLARPGVRFVNRQPGSGTRLWLDRLLEAAGLSAAAVEGYGAEEFTHRAVAALIASGAADAGMGARTAATAFGLGFVPLGRETYFLAARDRHADTLRAWVERLQSASSDRGA